MSGQGISVIIPAFNAERYLEEAVASVRGQTLQPGEIIVVDNGSTDRTVEIARKCGVRCEYEAQRGPAAARNRGLAAAAGDYFSLLDADDLWPPEKLEMQMQMLTGDSGLEAVFGQLAHFLSPDLAPEEAAKIHCPPEALPGRFPTLMLIRRAAFERVGPFCIESALGDVVDWTARAEEVGLKYAIVPHVVTLRRLHASNMGRTMRDQRGGYVRILKQKLDRERAAAQQSGNSAK